MAAWISSILWALLVAKMRMGVMGAMSGSYAKNCLEADPEFAFQQLAFFGARDELVKAGCGEKGASIIVEGFERRKIDRQAEG